jgi:hypothetical protein
MQRAVVAKLDSGDAKTATDAVRQVKHEQRPSLVALRVHGRRPAWL